MNETQKFSCCKRREMSTCLVLLKKPPAPVPSTHTPFSPLLGGLPPPLGAQPLLSWKSIIVISPTFSLGVHGGSGSAGEMYDLVLHSRPLFETRQNSERPSLLKAFCHHSIVNTAGTVYIRWIHTQNHGTQPLYLTKIHVHVGHNYIKLDRQLGEYRIPNISDS